MQWMQTRTGFPSSHDILNEHMKRKSRCGGPCRWRNGAMTLACAPYFRGISGDIGMILAIPFGGRSNYFWRRCCAQRPTPKAVKSHNHDTSNHDNGRDPVFRSVAMPTPPSLTNRQLIVRLIRGTRTWQRSNSKRARVRLSSELRRGLRRTPTRRGGCSPWPRSATARRGPKLPASDGPADAGRLGPRLQ